MSMTETELRDDLEELPGAEEFLEHFGISYDKRVVQVNRLHILQRFHDYLAGNPLTDGSDAFAHYGGWLEQAYLDFVGSSAQEQKALRVFKQPQPAFVSIDELDL
ncbi:nitrogenase-stabilizing/protective protein NifW [Motiliproteus sediminis]|uniref:nitrogenase-stabilizing/protective protein NifW n=1 Tax=Motiliproteus sediminis TaxID=1468178 RepID=UPI001AEFEBA4|nr:nitrogenase-stabilizing/protective protein NifW [Motiliproteus sediminis]